MQVSIDSVKRMSYRKRMSTGTAYLESMTKRRFDMVVATALLPAKTLARIGAAATFGYSIYSDKRVGQNGTLTTIPKITTLDTSGTPLSALANSYRQKGIDELEQLDLVLSGTMSIIGTRYLLPDEYEQMRDTARGTRIGRELLARYDDIVLPAKRGILSSFALQAHTMGDASVEQRLELDVKDHANASLTYDTQLIISAVGSLGANELKQGFHPVQ